MADHDRRTRRRWVPLRVAAAYLLAGGLWTLFSDALLLRLTGDPAVVGRLQTVKGWAFVLVTALLLYVVLRFEWSRITRSAQSLRRSQDDFQRLNRELTLAAKEQECRAASRAAEVEIVKRELEAFSYSVSHDLRAPLRSIDGFSHAVLEDAGDRLDPASRENLMRVRGAAKRMNDLIDSLLHLSRVTQHTLRPRDLDLTAEAERVVAVLREQRPDHHPSVTVQPALTAAGDPALCRTLLELLFQNAWKFTRSRSDARIQFAAGAEGGERVFFVKDNGAGFDMAYVHRLFQPFQRLHSAKEYEGAGIGLATAYRIVRRHGGRIWAEGTVGAGATIYFTLRPGEPP
jgi:light-regulated signal transduction histidine kinase (bacteriophytochrome)